MSTAFSYLWNWTQWGTPQPSAPNAGKDASSASSAEPNSIRSAAAPTRKSQSPSTPKRTTATSGFSFDFSFSPSSPLDTKKKSDDLSKGFQGAPILSNDPECMPNFTTPTKGLTKQTLHSATSQQSRGSATQQEKMHDPFSLPLNTDGRSKGFSGPPVNSTDPAFMPGVFPLQHATFATSTRPTFTIGAAPTPPTTRISGRSSYRFRYTTPFTAPSFNVDSKPSPVPAKVEDHLKGFTGLPINSNDAECMPGSFPMKDIAAATSAPPVLIFGTASTTRTTPIQYRPSYQSQYTSPAAAPSCDAGPKTPTVPTNVDDRLKGFSGPPINSEVVECMPGAFPEVPSWCNPSPKPAPVPMDVDDRLESFTGPPINSKDLESRIQGATAASSSQAISIFGSQSPAATPAMEISDTPSYQPKYEWTPGPPSWCNPSPKPAPVTPKTTRHMNTQLQTPPDSIPRYSTGNSFVKVESAPESVTSTPQTSRTSNSTQLQTPPDSEPRYATRNSFVKPEYQPDFTGALRGNTSRVELSQTSAQSRNDLAPNIKPEPVAIALTPPTTPLRTVKSNVLIASSIHGLVKRELQDYIKQEHKQPVKREVTRSIQPLQLQSRTSVASTASSATLVNPSPRQSLADDPFLEEDTEFEWKPLKTRVRTAPKKTVLLQQNVKPLETKKTPLVKPVVNIQQATKNQPARQVVNPPQQQARNNKPVYLTSDGKFSTGEKLKPYQLTDLQRLLQREKGETVCGTTDHNDTGYLLAYDMGLGKTVVSIALTVQNPAPVTHQGAKATLVIVPNKGIMSQWQSEIKKFAPHLRVCYYDSGSAILRPDADVVLCTYSQVQRQHSVNLVHAGPLFQHIWYRVIIDEAHKIRNPATKTAAAVWGLRKRHGLCLTGTPAQNSIVDFYPLFRFLNVVHENINDLPTFERKIYTRRQKGPIIGSSARKIFEAVKASFCIFRSKVDAETGEAIVQLPPRTDALVHVGLSPEERKVYDYVKSLRLPILAKIIRLRQACDHPVLISRALEGKIVNSDDGEDCGIHWAHALSTNGGSSVVSVYRLPEDLPRRLFTDQYKSSKLSAMLNVLKQRKKGEKTIVFTYFTSMIASIGDALNSAGIEWTQYTGEMTSKDQQASLADIAEDENCTVIVISINAGSIGLNITSCNNVILLEPWWNPYAEEQAISRVHRIGQTRPVNVFRLVTEESIEESIVKTQETKRNMVGKMYGERLDVATMERWLAGP
ncbi:P-loop containing nucleoside triphosphate hydrolase protein [Agrocybe pediades]|nr:P-loop containing nucleoside triphosphate hydrolase protein [Agrocybe pediades]